MKSNQIQEIWHADENTILFTNKDRLDALKSKKKQAFKRLMLIVLLFVNSSIIVKISDPGIFLILGFVGLIVCMADALYTIVRYSTYKTAIRQIKGYKKILNRPVYHKFDDENLIEMEDGYVLAEEEMPEGKPHPKNYETVEQYMKYLRKWERQNE